MQKFFDMPLNQDQIYQELENILTEYLMTNHMRKTPERYTILDQICKQKRAFSAEQIHTEITQNIQISLPTIYNAFLLFEKCGIIHKLERAAGEQQTLYERAKRRGIHMQLLCTDCGRLQDFYDKNIVSAVNLHRFKNFNPANFSLYVYGTCKHCNAVVKKSRTK